MNEPIDFIPSTSLGFVFLKTDGSSLGKSSDKEHQSVVVTQWLAGIKNDKMKVQLIAKTIYFSPRALGKEGKSSTNVPYQCVIDHT